MDIIDIQEQGLQEYQKRYTKMLAQSMRESKEVVARSIWEKGMQLPVYKIHMHAKKDWRVLRLVHGSYKQYETVSNHKSCKEAQAIMKLMEE